MMDYAAGEYCSIKVINGVHWQDFVQCYGVLYMNLYSKTG